MNVKQLIRAGWIPDQHGAWPMALLPIAIGCSLAGWSGAHVYLFLTWFFGFLFFNVAGPWLKARPGSRVRQRLTPAFRVYLVLIGVCLPLLLFSLGGVLVAANLLWAVVFSVLLGFTFWSLWRGSDRALAVRLATILASVLMLPVAFTLLTPELAGQWQLGWQLAVLCFWFFVGSTLFVRSVVRGRGEFRWLFASLLWHGVGCCLAVWVCPLSCVVGGVLLFTRAALVPIFQARGIFVSVKVIGLLELVSTLVFLVAVLV